MKVLVQKTPILSRLSKNTSTTLLMKSKMKIFSHIAPIRGRIHKQVLICLRFRAKPHRQLAVMQHKALRNPNTLSSEIGLWVDSRLKLFRTITTYALVGAKIGVKASIQIDRWLWVAMGSKKRPSLPSFRTKVLDLSLPRIMSSKSQTRGPLPRMRVLNRLLETQKIAHLR